MDYKELRVVDGTNLSEQVDFAKLSKNTVLHGEVEVNVINDLTGKVMFTKKGKNDILIGGMLEVGTKMSGMAAPIQVTKLDTALGIADVTSTNDMQIYGLGLSTDGGGTAGSVYPVSKHSSGFDLSYLIPFKIVDVADDDPVTFMPLYSLRKETGGKVYYYLKKFESSHMYARTVSGLDLTDFPDGQDIREDVEVILEYSLKLNRDECRQYFVDNEGSANAKRVSAITLFAGKEISVNVGGANYTDYTSVVGCNRKNLATIMMGDRISLDIRYRLVIK